MSAEPTPLELEQQSMGAPAEGVSVSLKYYQQETECFSEWSAAELKRFGLSLAKMRRMSSTELRGHLSLCDRHRNKTPIPARFSRPAAISKDLSMFEIRVGQHDKARIHGVFIGSVFHLIWLDRKHAVFPQ